MPRAALPSAAQGALSAAFAPLDTESQVDRHGAPPPPYAIPYAGYPYMSPHHAPYMQPGPQHGLALGYLNPFGHPPGAPMIPHSVLHASQAQAFCIASSSPPPICALDDYCETCGHNDATRTKLEALGFEPGDALAKILSLEYEKVGFKYLEWCHVVKADKAHHLLSKAQCS